MTRSSRAPSGPSRGSTNRRGELVGRTPQRGLVQALFAREVVVDERPRDARGRGYLVDGDLVGRAPAEQVEGDADQLLPPLLDAHPAAYPGSSCEHLTDRIQPRTGRIPTRSFDICGTRRSPSGCRPLIDRPSASVPFSPARTPPARSARRAGCPGRRRSPRRVARSRPCPLPAASRYQPPVPDFHSTPASTCGSRAPHAGEFSAFAATAPYAPAGRVELRQHPASRRPARSRPGCTPSPPCRSPSGSGCRANRQAFTDRTPCDAHGGSEQANGAQVRSAADARRLVGAAEGGPVVRWAGVSSPRSVSSRVPEPSVSCSTSHDRARAGLRPGWPAARSTRRCQRRGRIAPGRRLHQVPYGRLASPKGPSDSGRCRRPGRATSALGRGRRSPRRPGRSRARPRPCRPLRLGVPGDPQPVVQQHHARRCRPRPRTAAAAGRPGRPTGCRASPTPARPRRAAPRPRARGAAGRVSLGAVAARGPDGEVGTARGAATRWPPPSSAGPGPGRLRPPGSARTTAPPHRPGPSRRRAAPAARRTRRRPPRRPARPSCAGGGASDRWAGRAANRGRTRGSRAARRCGAGTVVRLRERRAPGPSTPAASSTRRTLAVGEPLQAAQHVGGARPDPTARTARWSRASSSAPPERGNSRRPHTCGSSGGSWDRFGHAVRRSGRPASSAVRRRAAVRRRTPGRRRSRPVGLRAGSTAAASDAAAPRQGPLGERVRGQHPPVAAQARRQHQIGEPDEPRIVLDERGLGLLDVDDRLRRRGCGGAGRHPVTARSAERANRWMVTAALRRVGRLGAGAARAARPPSAAR